MPTYRITAPDGRTYDVTGNGTAEEALAHVQSQYQSGPEPAPVKASVEPSRGKYITQAEREKQYRMANPQPSSMWDSNPEQDTRAAGALLGSPEAAVSLATGAVATPISGLAGLGAAPFVSDPAAFIERIRTALTYQPRSQGGRDVAGAIAYPFEKLAQGADAAGGTVTDATGSPLLGTAANVGIQAIPAILGRGRVGRGRSIPDPVRNPVAAGEAESAAAAAPKAGRNPGLAKVPEAPTLEELRAAKNEAYKAAENTGVVISRNAMTRLKVELMNDIKKEGIDKDLHPKALAAANRILNTKGQPSLTELETLRKVANDAKGSIDKAESRLGAKIVEKIDDFEANLSESDVISGDPAAATAFKEARALNTRVSKAETIGELFDRAKIKAGANFTQSGLENALRGEFKALALNKNKMRRFTAEERAAIEHVAKGGKMDNALRYIGKFAPTGPVSGAVSGALGLQFGGPLGAAVVGGTMAARVAATKMTLKNARAAEQLMRSGPQKKPVTQPEKVPAQ